MTLRLATPPEEAYGLIAEAISELSGTPGAAGRVTRVADPSRLSAAFPHQAYTMRSIDIARFGNLRRARLVAWRFLIRYGPRTLAAIELSCDPRGQNLRFASLDAGPFAQGTADAVRIVEQLDSVEQGSFEPRLLKAPSVYTLALWLKNLEGGEDIVLPIMPSGTRGAPPATGGAPLTQGPAQFLGDLRSAANDTLRSERTQRPPDDSGPHG